MGDAVRMSLSDSSPPAASIDIENALLDILARAGGKTLSAPEIAHTLDDRDWQTLIVPIRRAAVKLAQAGRLVIYRKGKIVDPTDFRGVYRLGLPRQD